MTDHTTPKTYRKKPVEIEVMRLIGSAGDTLQVGHWMEINGYPWLVGDATRPETLRYPDQAEDDDTKPNKGLYIDPATGDFMIRTLEGDMRATYGDYIIRGVSGEFYPCKPDIFTQTYEAVHRASGE